MVTKDELKDNIVSSFTCTVSLWTPRWVTHRIRRGQELRRGVPLPLFSSVGEEKGESEEVLNVGSHNIPLRGRVWSFPGKLV